LTWVRADEMVAVAATWQDLIHPFSVDSKRAKGSPGTFTFAQQRSACSGHLQFETHRRTNRHLRPRDCILDPKLAPVAGSNGEHMFKRLGVLAALHAAMVFALSAQTFTTLYSFGGENAGGNPVAGPLFKITTAGRLQRSTPFAGHH